MLHKLTNFRPSMTKNNIDNYRDETFQIYEEHELLCLSDNKFQHDGVNAMDCPHNRNYNEPKFIPLVNLLDIIKCSEDLKYFTGQLYLFHEYINNPLIEVLPNTTPLFSTYYQNFYDRRYSMFITCCFEKAYNFWDRIGDRLASFFPDLLPIHQVDFTRIIDAIAEKQELESDNFDWLHAFRSNEYKELNGFRKEVVHYYNYESTYKYNHNMNPTNFEKLQEFWEEKTNFPEYFKLQLNSAIKGHIRMINFTSELVSNFPERYTNN